MVVFVTLKNLKVQFSRNTWKHHLKSRIRNSMEFAILKLIARPWKLMKIANVLGPTIAFQPATHGMVRSLGNGLFNILTVSSSIFIHLHPSSSIFIHLPVSGYILYINLRWHTVTIFQWPAPKVSLPLFGVGSLYKKRPIPSSRPGRSWDGPTSDHCWYPFPEFQAAERLALYFAEGAAYDKSKCSKESLQHIPFSFFVFNPHFLWLTQPPCTSILLQKNPWKKRYITQQARRSPRATELWVPSWNKRKCSRKGM